MKVHILSTPRHQLALEFHFNSQKQYRRQRSKIWHNLWPRPGRRIPRYLETKTTKLKEYSNPLGYVLTAILSLSLGHNTRLLINLDHWLTFEEYHVVSRNKLVPRCSWWNYRTSPHVAKLKADNIMTILIPKCCTLRSQISGGKCRIPIIPSMPDIQTTILERDFEG